MFGHLLHVYAGLFHPEDGCSSMACPGLDTYYSSNCSRHGQGVHGGCALDGNGEAVCDCIPGYTGEACDVINKVL